MGKNLPAKNSMDKTKRKKNYRLRKSVRRTLGALFLISAIIVAAIPFPDAEATGGGVAPGAGGAVTAYTYAGGGTPMVSKNYIGVDMPAEPDNTKAQKALSTRLTDGSNQNYILYEQFYYKEQNGFKDANGTLGYVTGYNSTYVMNHTIELPEIISKDYVKIETKKYEDYYTIGDGAKEVSFDKNNPDRVKEFDTFFSTNQLYMEYKADPVNFSKDIKVKPTEALAATDKESYYLFKNHRNYWDLGYRMVSVIDRTGDRANSSANVPVYLLKGGNPPSAKSNDSNGFLIDSTASIIAIGEKAFEGVGNVENIILPSTIKYIGDSAFKGASLIKTLSLKGVVYIGNNAFEGCGDLTTLDCSNLVRIGTDAFRNCVSLRSVTLPSKILEIGTGAFSECVNLDSVDLSQVTATNSSINEAAFYNCPLGNLNMGGSTFTKVAKGAFATNSPGRDAMANVNMEKTHITTFEDEVFSGRTKLTEVRMPSVYGATSSVTLPDKFFYGCSNLAKLYFPEGIGWVKYNESIFSGIMNEQFVVEGPATVNGAMPTERTSTWKTTNGIVVGQKDNGDPVYGSVPYMYKEGNQIFYEVKSGDYILSLKLNSDGSTATVAKCNFADGVTSTSGLLIIPANVGPYQVVKLEDGCFSEAVKQDIKTISNNSLTEIGDNVFQGALKLETVTFGDSMQKIGRNAFQGCTSLTKVEFGGGITEIKDSAFEGCPKLTEVVFGTPLGGAASFPKENIGTRALSTGSKQLAVTGIIEEGYGPFEWAMDTANFVDSSMGIRVLYKTPAPSNLSVILDNRNELVTLVDYPQYGNLDAGIRQKYEAGSPLTPAEEAAVNAAVNIDIPAGVESIDVKGYLNNEPYTGGTGNTNSYNRTAYFTDARFDNYAKYGLFSGETNDATSDPAKKNETKDIGNDRIRSVTMRTVKYLPNSNTPITGDILSDNGLSGGAFYSCENLETVSLGSAMEDVGSLPFLGCYNLSSIASDNPKYVCNNKILYENLADGSKKIVEVLGSRGNANDKLINVANDPDLANVSSMAVGAVSDVPGVRTVDFTGNDVLREIPDKAFLGSKGLSDVILPTSIRTIGLKAFAEGAPNNLRVSIYGREVSLATDAFVNTPSVTVYAYDDSAAYNTAKKIATLYDNVYVETLTDVYRVQFFDYDGITALSEVQYVEKGKNAELPETNPTRAGYVFKGWNKSHKDIQQDTDIIALYDIDPNNPGGGGNGNGNGTGGNGNGGNGTGGNGPVNGTTVPGGIDVDGDGIADYDKDGNKLYNLTVTGGNGTGRYIAGQKVSIMATGGATGSTFGNWSSSNTNVIFDDATKSTTTLIMPASDATVIANYAGQYRLEVKYGSGSGSYPAGTKVSISAVEPPAGKKFYRWATETAGLTIESSTSTTTTITMPSSNAVVEATYTNSTGTASGGGGGNGVTGTTGTTSNNKTSVIITRPGISDTDQASAYVSGSTDGFVVKISQSAEADAAALAALQKEYPDMSRIKFAAMDISLYDATGANLITDTTGLKVNITMPIPDALRTYAGNNKIAGVVDETLDKLGVKFVTMNGVPCMSFTATHFSPYVVYVDTGNLVAGDVLDQTPKTGDGIHPKWFLSIGLASISMILFLKRDPKYKTRLS